MKDIKHGDVILIRVYQDIDREFISIYDSDSRSGFWKIFLILEKFLMNHTWFNTFSTDRGVLRLYRNDISHAVVLSCTHPKN